MVGTDPGVAFPIVLTCSSEGLAEEDAPQIPNDGDGDTLAGFAVTTDQRHLARPEQSGGKCDIGAVEVQLPPAPAPAAAPVETVIRFTG